MNYDIVFEILHYNSIEVTQKCIESIMELELWEQSGIVIVDNASPNGSGMKLQAIYKDYANIHVVLLRENQGFAKGNNAGYSYAKEYMNAKCIICSNNDVCFVQKDFIKQIKYFMISKIADVVGPDIRTYNEKHQNPLRSARLSYKQFYKKHIIKKCWLLYWKINRHVKFIPIITDMRKKMDANSLDARNYLQPAVDNVVHGACIVFFENYIQHEKEAFAPETFMYMEEDILAYKCFLKGYKVVYTPELYVFHAESLSTAQSFNDNVEKEIFYYSHSIQSDKVLLRYIKASRKLTNGDRNCDKKRE